MSLTKLTDNLNKVSSLPDKPTLQSNELKAVFDEAGNAIKDYINDTLTTEIEKLVSDTAKSTKTTVENVLTSKSAINALSALQGKELKDLIDNIKLNLEEKINGTVLYENESGTSSEIELSESIINFKKIEIYTNRGNICNFNAINGEKTIVSSQSLENGGKLRQFFCNITFNEKTITFGTQFFRDSDGHGQEYTGIKIIKVIGYK